MTLIKAYIAAGQPHFHLAPERSPGWASLRRSYESVGRSIAASDAELLLVYSTQWFSVIGHLFQVDPKPQWTLVDQNWYEFGEIPYEFRIDPEFGRLHCEIARSYGMQASAVDYHGFPIDPGTVVALQLLNPGNAIPASVVSCNIYAERDETRLLGRASREAIERYGKKTILVCVTNLSNRYHVTEIDPTHDAISSAKDDEWNRKILEMLDEGRLQDVTEVARDFAHEANADMGFKAIWWLGAAAGETNQYVGRVHDYQPVWGTGAALVELTPTDKPPEFEKEYDEIDVEAVSTEAAVRTRDTSSQSSLTAKKAPKPVGSYPHARRIGDLLYLSGIGPRSPETDEVPGNRLDAQGALLSYDIDAQTRAVIANLSAILEEAGSSLERLVDVTVFLTDMKRDFAAFNRIWTEHFSEHQPTRTTVGVDSLPTPIAVEFKAIAQVG